MLQQMRKPVALICALLMCLAMFTGIVLPRIAETATAVADPYADVHAKVDPLTVTDGKVTAKDGTTVEVPEEYIGLPVYEAKDTKLFFYNSAWKTPADAGVTAAEDYFVARYGDGVTWGDGKVYLMQYGVNAYGGTSESGAYAYDNLRWKLQQIVPTAGGDNNYYIVFFPGTYGNTNGTSSEAGGSGNMFQNPTNADPAKGDIMHIHYVGPQAGKNPTTGVVGDTTVNNGRSVDTSREFVTTTTFWFGRNIYTHIDGLASTQPVYYLASVAAETYAGVEIRNVYAKFTANATYPMFRFGTDLTKGGSMIVNIEDCYFDGNAKLTTNDGNDIYGHKITLKNVVFKDINNQHLNLLPCLKSFAACAFNDQAGTYELNVIDCTFIDWENEALFRPYASKGDCASYIADTSATINFTGNKVINFGYPAAQSVLLYLEGVKRADEDKGVAAVLNPYTINLTENFFEISPAVTASALGVMITTNNYPTGSLPINVHRNTFKADLSTGKMTDINSCDALLDLSDNLFLDANNNVRVSRTTSVSSKFDANAKVCSDIYASDEFSGGITELFTVLDAKQDLFVANSFIQTTLNYGCNNYPLYGTDILGTITIMPKPGVTYQTKDLFIYNNPNVAFVGVFSDKACTNAVSSFNSTFTELYAKAQYKAGSTTATVVYRLHQPTEYRFVSLTGATSYTFPFDGITYTNGATASNGVTATFHSTFAAAANATVGKRPTQTNGTTGDINYYKAVMVLTPGTYTVDQDFAYGCPIVGPMLGVSPSDGKTDVVQNGRGVDASKEAVLNAKLTFHPTDNPYIAIGGIASAYTSNLVKINEDVDLSRTAHVSIQDFCYIGASNSNLCLLGVNSGKWDCRITMDNVYYKTSGTATPIGDLHGRMGRLTNSSITMTGRTGAWLYMAVSNDERIGYNPASADFVLENNFITRPAGTNYGIAVRTNYYDKTQDEVANYVQGVNVRINGNTIKENNDVFIRLMFDESVSTLQFKNNRVINSTANAKAVLDTYKWRVDPKTEADISGNVFLNCTKPFNFTFQSSVDVNENFFGDLNSKVIPVASNSSAVLDTSWYYVNEACTVKSSDIELAKGGFVGVEIVDGLQDYEAVLTATSGRTYGAGNFAAANAEVTGIYSDPACEYALGEVKFDGTDKVVYVRVSKDNYIATWKVTLKLASVWGEKGLAPTGSETFVDLSTTDKYASRAGGNSYPFVFLSSNWTDWAYTDATLTTKSNADEANLEEGVDGTDWNAMPGDSSATADPRELKVGTVFYAKMPTTGIIYKLTYGVTAMNTLHCNTGNFATMVFFPGLYNKKMGYDSSSASYNYREDATGAGWVGLFRGELAACTEFNILGPQAGIPGGNVEAGTGRASTSYAGTNSVLGEAVFAYATPFYLMNGGLGTDDVINIDGIGGGWGFRMSTAAGTGASFMYSNTDTSTINIKNCSFRALDGGQYFLQFHGNGENINTNLNDDNNGTGNGRATKHNLIVNFDRTCIELEAGSKTYGLAKMSANQIHFNECVLLNKRAASTDPYGFYINPVRGDKNATKVDVSYTCENSYLNWQNGYLFGVYLNGTTGLNKNNRNKIEVAFRNNVIVDAAKNTTNNSRAALVSFYTSATSGNNLADAAAITEIEMTGNTVTNTASGYPTYGYMIYGFDSDSDNFSGYKSVNISKNTFKGYNNMFPYFDDYDLADNIYLDINGRFMSGRFHATSSRCYTSDIVLAEDYSKHASDFVVKGGVQINGDLTWAPGALDITGNATVNYKAGMKATDLENSLIFNSDNIKVVDLYEADGVTPATDLEAETTYRLVLTYKDAPDLVQVVYNVTVGKDPTDLPLYSGGKVFYDPDVAAYSKNSSVIRTVDGKDYQFIVGKNVHASLDDFEIITGLADANGNAACARHVYLFAKEYGTPNGSLSMPENIVDNTYRHMTTYFYGAQAGISAVKTVNGIAVDRADNRKDPAAETVFRDASFSCGYQSNVSFDGVMFAGLLKVTESSPERGSYISEFVVKNCTTHPDAPVYGNGDNWKCFFLSSNTMMYDLEFHDNYFEAADNGKSGNLIVVRCAEDIVISNSVFVTQGVNTGFLFDSTETAAGTGATNASLENHSVAVTGCTLGGHLKFDSLRTQKATFPISIKVLGNNFDLEQQGSGITFLDYSGSAEKGIVDFANSGIEIKDNTFTGGPQTNQAIYLSGKRTADLDDKDFALFNLVDNTFISTDEAPLGYAIHNLSDTVLDASRNTFVGFESNYGNRDYEPAAAPELCVINKHSLALNLTEHNVLFSGISNATFTIDGVDYKANATVNDVTVANAAASGAKVADGTTITDVATVANGTVYAFNPAKGMMVKITDAEGNVYYNAIPIFANKNNAKATFTAQLITLDGTETVGDPFTVTAYAEPIKLNVTADKCSAIHDFEAGTATLTWTGTFRGNHSTYITDLINKSGFAIVEYGMYYANDEAAVGDVAIKNGYVDGKYTVDSVVKGQKVAYASDANGLSEVKLDYAQQFTVTLPAQTEARYGRMYMTYKVGDATYTVLSDTVALTMYVAN